MFVLFVMAPDVLSGRLEGSDDRRLFTFTERHVNNLYEVSEGLS